MALERVIPIPRHTARLTLAREIEAAELQTPAEAVEYFVQKFFVVPPAAEDLERIAVFLEQQLGSKDLPASLSFAEEALRSTLHLLLSLPEFQLG